MISAGDIINFKTDTKEHLGVILAGSDSSKNLLISYCEEEPDSSNQFVKIEKDDLEGDLEDIQGKKYILLYKIITIKTDKYPKIARIRDRKFKEVLRAFNHYSAHVYYESFILEKSSKYIPAAGKLLDENDLFNMVDASLDFWLTAYRFDQKFCNKLREFLGRDYVLTTNSGSSANLLAISCLTSPKLGERSLKPGDEVITVASGFPTTVAPIIQNGLVPVFVDLELETYNIDVNQIQESISDKTRAIFIAHTLGNPFNINKVLEIAESHNLWVIEDNCDALGSKYNNKYTGSFGHISTFSFYPAHHITMGEGGAVSTDDEELYKIILSLRDWGRDCYCAPGKDNTCGMRFTRQFGELPEGYDHKYVYSHLGYNLKITDWQAAIGLSQLEKLPSFILKRHSNFDKLYSQLADLKDYFHLPKASDNSEPSWFGFPLTIKDRAGFSKKELVSYLEDKGIGTRGLFAGNILRQPVFTDGDVKLRIRNSKILSSGSLSFEDYQMLPVSDIIMNSTFWLGVWPGIGDNENNYVSKNIREFIENYK